MPEITFFQIAADAMALKYSEALEVARKAWGETASYNVSCRLPADGEANGMIIITLNP